MKKKYKYLIVIAPLVFILDQLTKFFIIESVPMNTGFAVIPGFFDIVHVTNKGAAFGMFSQSASALREPFFNIVAVVALIFITVYFFKMKKEEEYLKLPLSLIVGGIFGNALDRIRLGAVTDFLSLHIGDKMLFGVRLSWPAFNVADSAISIAMAILIWKMLKMGKEERGK